MRGAERRPYARWIPDLRPAHGRACVRNDKVSREAGCSPQPSLNLMPRSGRMGFRASRVKPRAALRALDARNPTRRTGWQDIQGPLSSPPGKCRNKVEAKAASAASFPPDLVLQPLRLRLCQGYGGSTSPVWKITQLQTPPLSPRADPPSPPGTTPRSRRPAQSGPGSLRSACPQRGRRVRR